MDCRYGWDVTAYDADGILLARPGSTGIFEVRNDMLPWCQIRLTSPGYREEISSGSFKLEWELHPLAVRYRIGITKNVFEIGWYIGDVAVREDGSLSSPSPALPYFGSGWYKWGVSAYTEDGGYIAYGESTFRVP
jgi:hypothetical protein